MLNSLCCITITGLPICNLKYSHKFCSFLLGIPFTVWREDFGKCLPNKTCGLLFFWYSGVNLSSLICIKEICVPCENALLNFWQNLNYLSQIEKCVLRNACWVKMFKVFVFFLYFPKKYTKLIINLKSLKFPKAKQLMDNVWVFWECHSSDCLRNDVHARHTSHPRPNTCLRRLVSWEYNSQSSEIWCSAVCLSLS